MTTKSELQKGSRVEYVSKNSTHRYTLEVAELKDDGALCDVLVWWGDRWGNVGHRSFYTYDEITKL